MEEKKSPLLRLSLPPDLKNALHFVRGGFVAVREKWLEGTGGPKEKNALLFSFYNKRRSKRLPLVLLPSASKAAPFAVFTL